MNSTCRFAAGERTGLKSGIWTVKVNKNDIYLLSNLFGSDFKLSLHEPSEGHWAYTNEYVARQGDMKNQDRHLIKWNYTRSNDDLANPVYRIQIPHSELRNYPPPTKKVKWASGIIRGTYQFDFFITKPADDNPCEGRSDLPYPVVESLQLANKRWLVIFFHPEDLNANDIDNRKRSAITEMEEKGIIMDEGWIALFGIGDDGVPLVMEFHYGS